MPTFESCIFDWNQPKIIKTLLCWNDNLREEQNTDILNATVKSLWPSMYFAEDFYWDKILKIYTSHVSKSDPVLAKQEPGFFLQICISLVLQLFYFFQFNLYLTFVFPVT